MYVLGTLTSGCRSLADFISELTHKNLLLGALGLGVAVGATPASAAPFLDDFSADTSANYVSENSYGGGGSFEISGGTLNITTGSNNTFTVTTANPVSFDVGESLGVDVIGQTGSDGVFLTLGTAAGQPGGDDVGYRWRRDAGGGGLRPARDDIGIFADVVDPDKTSPATLWIDRTLSDTFEFKIQLPGEFTRTSVGTNTYAALDGLTNLHIGMQAFDTASDLFPFDNLRILDTDFVEDIPTLTLSVNKTTGFASIENSSGVSLEIDYYLIESAAGALDPTGWNSFSNQNLDPVDGGDDPGETWDEAGGSDEFQLAELFLKGSSIFADGASEGLGSAFDTSVFGSGNDGDLEFLISLVSGQTLIGDVEYIVGGDDADFNQDGNVDGTDFLTWQRNNGAAGGLAQGDADGNGIVNGIDRGIWESQFGTTGSVSASVTAAAPVPEPSTLTLVLVGLVGTIGLAGRRGLGRKEGTTSPEPAALRAVAVLFVAWAVSGSTAQAAVTNDREYQFGDPGTSDAILAPPDVDAAANVGEGNLMGFLIGGTRTTGDDTGPSGGGFVDLVVSGPTYTGTASRPGAGASDFGANFDGADDYLEGLRLGNPATSVSSTGSAPPAGPLNYDGITDRGFQFWANPNSAGNGTTQSVVADTLQHGVQISSNGTWSMVYNEVVTDSGVAVNFDAWTHVMLVRPSGAAGPSGGSRLFVDGVAVAAQLGGYDAADDTPLVVGANTGDDDVGTPALPPGTADFFQGAIDNLELFVLGVATTAPFDDYGTFDYAADNQFAAAALTGLDGDVNQDGLLTPTDVDDFVAGFLSVNLVNGIQVGDITSIKDGDLNLNGVTDLDDAFLLHEALVAAGAGGLVQFGFGVPEPASAMLLL
ncbi:PEP-CTERM sorting domain-containing protein, partial [Pirellulales bacterium]|nr:PEP-CTERM sorting domain-containing protein [Pirellulales bacterium]